MDVTDIGHGFFLQHFDRRVILVRYFGRSFYISRECADQSARANDSKSKIYEAEILDRISCKKFSDKPNRVK